MAAAVDESALPSISTFANLLPLEERPADMLHRMLQQDGPAAVKREEDDLGKFVDLDFILAHTSSGGQGPPGPNYPLPETPESCGTTYDSDGSYPTPGKFPAPYPEGQGHSYVAELLTPDLPGHCDLQRREYTELRVPGGPHHHHHHHPPLHPALSRPLPLDPSQPFGPRIKKEQPEERACMLGMPGGDYLGPGGGEHKPPRMAPGPVPGPPLHCMNKCQQLASKEVQVWESLGHPHVERSNENGKTQGPNGTQVFVSMVMSVVTDTYEETADR
eukprot:XP_027324475.1 basic salivary proline-rich protein 4-like [Anas platyrhynchos]